MLYQEYTTRQGLRILHYKDHSPVIYAGYGIAVGSDQDPRRYYGMAHIVEHMLFKGTPLRNATRLIRRVEEIGAEINAFTGKNDTFVHAIFPADYSLRIIQVLTDIVLNSTIPVDELEKEKSVILEEISSYEDAPSEMIFDDFENFYYHGTPLAHNILGTQDSVTRVTRDAIKSFIRKHYVPDNMILCIQGNVDLKPIIQRVEDAFEKASPFLGSSIASFAWDPSAIRPFTKTIRQYDTTQAHCVMGFEAPSIYSSDKSVMTLMNNWLGGPALSSVLNMLLREQQGLVYNIESNYSVFRQSGLESIYWGCSKKNIEQSLQLVHEVLDRLCEVPLTLSEISAAKRQLKGQIALLEDNRESKFLSIAKRYLHHSSFGDIDELIQNIEKVSPEDILRLAQTYCTKDKRCTLIYR